MSNIEWTDRTWNPLRGCTPVSEGCRHCYAAGVAARFSGPGLAYEGLAERRLKVFQDGTERLEPKWTGRVRFVAEKLSEPLSWKKPGRVFVNSMSDLFHEAVSNEEIAAVFAVMAIAPQHTFQVLTKRPERMLAWFEWASKVSGDDEGTAQQAAMEVGIEAVGAGHVHRPGCGLLREGGAFCDCDLAMPMAWPLPNVWLGVSVENQKAADERIPLLLQTPAVVRFLSVEPLLGPLSLMRWLEDDDWGFCNACCKTGALTYFSGACGSCGSLMVREGRSGLSWVIVGGESGHGARPCDIAWIRSVVEQCRAALVDCFVKQLGARPVADGGGVDLRKMWDGSVGGPDGLLFRIKDKKGGDMAEWPADLRVRDFPKGGHHAR